VQTETNISAQIEVSI